MTDFNFVTPRLATGGAIGVDAADVQQLVAAGITHVICCNAEEDDVTTFKQFYPAEAVLNNGVQDDGQSKPDSWFAASLSFALSALAQPKMKVYAHCAAGVNRGPSTAYAIMRACGFAGDNAVATMKAARPQVGIAYRADADRAVVDLGYA